MDAFLKIVNDFDKVEGYDKWLNSQVPKNGLDVGHYEPAKYVVRRCKE